MNSLPVQPCVYVSGTTFRFAEFLAEIEMELLITFTLVT